MTALATPGTAQSPVGLLTAEALAQLPQDDGQYELVQGVVIQMPRPKYGHGRIAGILTRLLGNYAEEHHLGQVVGEMGFIIARNPDTVRAPDLAFIAAERAAQPDDQDRYFDGAPDLAVEIVSPNDNAMDLRAKIDGYFAAHARLVWVIYPLFKTVEVHKPDNTMVVLRAEDTLDGDTVLPGLHLPVQACFE